MPMLADAHISSLGYLWFVMKQSISMAQIRNGATGNVFLYKGIFIAPNFTHKQDQSLYRVECTIDETQQYLRRDCFEINGVPISSYENPNQLFFPALF